MEKNLGLFNSTRGHDTFTSACQYSNFHLASTWQIYDESARKEFSQLSNEEAKEQLLSILPEDEKTELETYDIFILTDEEKETGK